MHAQTPAEGIESELTSDCHTPTVMMKASTFRDAAVPGRKRNTLSLSRPRQTWSTPCSDFPVHMRVPFTRTYHRYCCCALLYATNSYCSAAHLCSLFGSGTYGTWMLHNRGVKVQEKQHANVIVFTLREERSPHRTIRPGS